MLLHMTSIKTEKIYDYQMQLINRRWQYFATYLFLIGILANAVPKDLWSAEIVRHISEIKDQLSLIASSGTFLGVIFTQLVSRATMRIQHTEQRIGLANSITAIKRNGRFLGLFSETVILYVAIYFFSMIWLLIVFYASCWIFTVLIILLLVNLYFLRWKSIFDETEL